MRKSKAFTLSEILIALTIIGIVAALTIPRLIANYKAKELKSRLNEAYSILSQAIEKMRADSVPLTPNDYGDNKFQPVFIQYFTKAIDCGTYHKRAQNIGCAYNNPEYYTFKKSALQINAGGSLFDDGRFVLSNGMFVMLENQGDGKIFISIDTNGSLQKPNRFGYDLFTFQLINEKLEPMGNQKTSFQNETIYCSLSSTYTYNGIGCTAKALSDPKYFKNLPR